MNAKACVSRRDFLAAAQAAGALILGVRLGRPAIVATLDNVGPNFSPNMWLCMATSGEIQIWLAKAEMGQGVYTALPMLVADELDANGHASAFCRPTRNPSSRISWALAAVRVCGVLGSRCGSLEPPLARC